MAKRPRDAAAMADALLPASISEEDKSTAETAFTARDHAMGANTKTLYSADLGFRKGCFLCDFTDAHLLESTIFAASDAGPIEEVKRMWREGADTCDTAALARDCCDLLRRKMSAFDFLTPAAEGTGEHPPRAVPEITPESVLRHFMVCETTRNARLDALKGSFRHLTQLEQACASSMYERDEKTGKARPNAQMAQLLLKANSAMMRTCAQIGSIEGGKP